jgi:hypothetical protein
MNRKLSQRLLVAEAVVLALPLTALMAVGLTTVSPDAIDEFWPWLAVDLVTVLAAVSVVAGWWLIVKAVRGGAEALRSTSRVWWITASLGSILVLASVVSILLPPSSEYSPTAFFREHLERCILGAPLVVILVHLWAEARFRRSANNTLQATRETRAPER